MITREQHAVGRGTPVAGAIASADHLLARHLIEHWMRQSGAHTALAREVRPGRAGAAGNQPGTR